MADGWSFSGEPAHLGSGQVTIVEGSSFCVCEPSGDIRPGTPQGVFVQDTRILACWQLQLDSAHVQPLAVMTHEPWWTTFVGRGEPRRGASESTLVVRRDRYVGDGMREDIVVQNVGREAAAVRLQLLVAADFADLFEVKESRVPHRPEPDFAPGDGELRLTRTFEDGSSRGVRILWPGASGIRAGLTRSIVVPPRQEWRAVLEVLPEIDGAVLAPRFPADQPVTDTWPARLARQWREVSPVVVTTDEDLGRTLARSRQDLGALRIFDPSRPDVPVVAAGAPWFMALFGRDSLLTSWMALPVDQHLAMGTLETLARFQGSRVDPLTEEEPGRILHEVRLGAEGPVVGGRSIYYGTADATPLFVMLLGELHRWGADSRRLAALLPAADRALDWIRTYGDRDGDGFVEYQRATDRGLLNQGWKDSFDALSFANGTLANAPIALAEVQGYAFAAMRSRALLASARGDQDGQERWTRRAESLKAAFNERFWLSRQHFFAMGLDGEKRAIDAIGSNVGHCLWTGIVDEQLAGAVAERLLEPDMFTGWGIRTLSSRMARYNPMSYHNGSVWPHDTAIAVAGLMRYGFVDEAQKVAGGLLEAAVRFEGRLPELFCGFQAEDYPNPVPFPTSCSPQAWASAAPLLVLRALLRFDPCVPMGCAWLAPALPAEMGPLTVQNVSLGGSRLSLSTTGKDLDRLDGLPPAVRVARAPRPTDTACA